MDTAVVTEQKNAVETEVVSVQTAELAKEIGIPPCPAVLVEFTAEANKEEPDFRRLSHLINKDVALAASVLKTINSPFYGLGEKGAHRTRCAHFARSAADQPADRGTAAAQGVRILQSPAMFEYWDSSAKIALLAATSRASSEVCDLEEAHTFALFRDCGVPALLTRYPRIRADCCSMTRNENEQRRCEMERAQFGFDHALVGATLAQILALAAGDVAGDPRAHALCEADFRDDPHVARFAPLIALALLAERLQRTHRGTFDAEAWSAEEQFIAEVLGPVQDRLEPLDNDIKRILRQV